MSKCPFCGERNKIEFYMGFRHCKSCNKDFDMTTYNERELDRLWNEIKKECVVNGKQ